MSALGHFTLLAATVITWAIAARLRSARSRARTAPRRPLAPESLTRVASNDQEVTVTSPDGTVCSVAWAEITEVRIRTTSDGPLSPDVFWVIQGAPGTRPLEFPSGSTGEEAAMAALHAHLGALDSDRVIDAMTCTDDQAFVVWTAATG